MSNNKAFWRVWLEGRKSGVSSDKSGESASGKAENQDSLDLGLEALAVPEKGNRVLFRKRPQTFGEEIGNSITHGVMAIFTLGMLPYAAIRSYINAPAGMKVIDPLGVSIFVICIFLMFISSTIYHAMSKASPQKEVMHRIDHIMIYFAIAGTYTPICLSVIGGKWGIGLCVAQWVLVIGGTLFKALAFSKSAISYIVSVSIYLLMGWMVVLCFPVLWGAANVVTFWLIVAGGICYTGGVVCFALKFKFHHMVWHFLVDFGALCHFIAIVYFMR